MRPTTPIGLVAVAVLAGASVGAAPAAATVTFDFATNIGFVDAADLMQGFDWKAGRLARKASTVEFQNAKYIEELWSVTCRPGEDPWTATRPQQAMKLFLTATAAYTPGKVLTGFRITGTKAGISSTTAPFEVGGPCPDPAHGETVRTLRQVATTTTLTLTATAGDESTVLLQTRTGPLSPRRAAPRIPGSTATAP